ncbi:MAG: kelch repeat-containing protein, partial [Planctomycetota bacterium]
KPTPPYSEMTFNFEKRQWENALPDAGKSWGGLTGPVNAPTFGYGSGLRKGKDGLLRPDLRGGYGTQVYHLFACDTDRKRVLFGLNMEYDPAARSWRKLEVKGHPGTANLPPFEVKAPVMPAWSQMCYDPVNKEFVLFGGTKVVTESGAPGTWVFSAGKNEWRKLVPGTERQRNFHRRIAELERKTHALVTACRNRYYSTELKENADGKLSEVLRSTVKGDEIEQLSLLLVKADGPPTKEAGMLLTSSNRLKEAHAAYAKLLKSVDASVDAKTIAAAANVRALVRRAKVDIWPEPPPRCFSPMVFDPASGKIVLFGGSGLSHAKSDTWLYDPKTRTWEERRPKLSPSPRLAHGLVYLPKAEKVALVGGWVGRPGVGCGGFVGSSLPPEIWTYDVKNGKWSLVKRWEGPKGKGAEHLAFPRPGNAPQFFAADENDAILTLAPGRKGPSTWACRVDASATDSAGAAKHGAKPGAEHYPGGYCSPEWYDSAPPPDAKRTEAELKSLPVNKWVKRSEGSLQRPTFAYCSIAYDPDRDQIMTFAGGHGTWHGADVGRYSLATDRWHTDHYAHVPLTFGYFATGGSYGYGFRPWMGVHTWGGYGYDTVTKKLVILTGMREFAFTYDCERGRFERPWSKLPPGGSSWTCKATPTPKGIVAWTGGRKAKAALWRLDPEKKAWVQISVKGKLVAPDIDRSTLVWDSKRSRLLIMP